MFRSAADKCKQIKGQTSILVTLSRYGLAERNGCTDCGNTLQSMSSIYYTFPRGVSQHMFTYSVCLWLCFSAVCKFPLEANILNAAFASSCSEGLQIQRLLSAATLASSVIPPNTFINKMNYGIFLTSAVSTMHAKRRSTIEKNSTFR